VLREWGSDDSPASHVRTRFVLRRFCFAWTRSSSIPFNNTFNIQLFHTLFIMEDDKQLLEQKSVQIRQELKVWEKQFSTDNEGRKAGREDIKANSSIGTCIHSLNMHLLTRNIAAKYKKIQQTTRRAFRQSKTSTTSHNNDETTNS